MKQTEQFRFAQRVNERGASTSAAGVRSDVSGLARDWEGDCLSRDTMFRAKLRHQVSRIHNLLIILLINISIK